MIPFDKRKENNITAIVKFTTPSDKGISIKVPYPPGFEIGKFYISGGTIKYSDNNIRNNLYEWLDIYQTKTGFTVTIYKELSDPSGAVNKEVKLILTKIIE